MRREALVRAVPTLFHVGLPLLLILPILRSGSMLFGQDVASVFHYSRMVIAAALKSGRLPVWDPHVMAGFPLLAGMQGAVFYPLSWFCVACSAGRFWTLSAAVHLALAGVFADRWLVRGLGASRVAALAGSLIYMLSGYLLGHLYAGHVNYVWAYPWIAAILWRVERMLAGPTLGRGVRLAAVFAMLVLSGVPQYVLFVGLLVAARLARFVMSAREGRRIRALAAVRCGGGLLLGFLLCAPQLLPTFELIGQMQRGASPGEEFQMGYSLSPQGLLGIVYPSPASLLAGGDSPYFWETCGFIGAAAAVLAMAAFLGRHPERWLWGGVASAALVLALGSRLPFYRGFLAVVPGAALFQGPGRYLLLFTVSASALASLGFDALWGRSLWGGRIPAGALGTLAGIQLLLNASALCLPQDPNRLQWPASVAADLRLRCGLEGRVASTGDPDLTSVGRCQAAGIDQVCGYEPMMLRRYAEFMNAARGAPIDTYMPILAAVPPNPALDPLSIRVWCSSRHGQKTFVEQTHPMPRAWLVQHAVVVESREERLRLLGSDRFDPRRTVVLETVPDEAPPERTGRSPGAAQVVARTPGEYQLAVENDADAYLVLSEAYYPGWSAEVDGRPAELRPADHLLQAIRLAPGHHDVRFFYRSRFLAAGIAIAALAAIATLLSWLIRKRRG